MRRQLRLGAPALALTSVLFSHSARAEQEHVSSLEAPTLDWPEARRSVEAELRAGGFEVTTEQSSAVEPSQLLTELESASEGLAGRVTIIRIGATGLAYVRVPSQRRTYRVLAPPVEPGVAAGMLALRVVELLSLHPSPPEKASREAVARPLPSEARPTSTELTARFGLGAGFGAGLRSPTTRALLAVDAPLLAPLHAELYGAGSLFSGTLALEDGSASLQEHELGLHALLSTAAAPGWAAAGGLGVALQCLQIFPSSAGTSEPHQQTTCVVLTSAPLRAGFQWDTLGLWTMLEPGLSLPSVRLKRDDETIAKLGLWVSATAGLQWQL